MALLRVGAAGGGHAPAGALAAASGDAVAGELAARVTRLLRPQPGLPVIAIALLGLVAAFLVLAPVAALLTPL
jgi:hypothetical protein